MLITNTIQQTNIALWQLCRLYDSLRQMVKVHFTKKFLQNSNNLPKYFCVVAFINQDPHQCGEADTSCRAWMSQYSLGVRGPICLPEDVGARFGKDSFKNLLLQVHWNNKNLSANFSGN